ncbi:CLPB isoform 12, partial [Pan troglodytes]
GNPFFGRWGTGRCKPAHHKPVDKCPGVQEMARTPRWRPDHPRG